MNDPGRLSERLKAIFEERLSVTIDSPETDLVESGLLDSLSFVQLLVSLEEEFGIRVSLDDLDLDNFRSLDRIAQFVGAAK